MEMDDGRMERESMGKELSRLTNHTSKSVAFPCYARYDLTAGGSGCCKAGQCKSCLVVWRGRGRVEERECMCVYSKNYRVEACPTSFDRLSLRSLKRYICSENFLKPHVISTRFLG